MIALRRFWNLSVALAAGDFWAALNAVIRLKTRLNSAPPCWVASAHYVEYTSLGKAVHLYCIMLP